MCVCARGGGAGVPPERIAKVLTGGTSQIGSGVFSDVHSIGHTVDKIYVQSTEGKDLSKQIFFFFPFPFLLSTLSIRNASLLCDVSQARAEAIFAN